MAEGSVDTQGGLGTAGPAQSGQPAPPPAPAAPAPAASPDAAAKPAAEGRESFVSTDWQEAAKEEQQKVEQEKQRRKSAEGRLKELSTRDAEMTRLYGPDYVERLRQGVPAPVVPQPVQRPVEPVQGGQSRQGMDPRTFGQWIGRVYTEFDSGKFVTEPDPKGELDPNTGSVKMVQTWVPPNKEEALNVAYQFDAQFRALGLRPPWGNLVREPETPAPAAPAPAQPPTATEDFYTIQRHYRAWESGFSDKVQKLAETQLGTDWMYDQQIELGDGRKMTRSEFLIEYCSPTRENPEGISPVVGLVQLWPQQVMAQMADIVEQSAIDRVMKAGGVIPSASMPTPRMNADDRRELAAALTQRGLLGGNLGMEPHPDMGRPVRILGGRR